MTTLNDHSVTRPFLSAKGVAYNTTFKYEDRLHTVHRQYLWFATYAYLSVQTGLVYSYSISSSMNTPPHLINLFPGFQQLVAKQPTFSLLTHPGLTS